MSVDFIEALQPEFIEKLERLSKPTLNRATGKIQEKIDLDKISGIPQKKLDVVKYGEALIRADRLHTEPQVAYDISETEPEQDINWESRKQSVEANYRIAKANMDIGLLAYDLLTNNGDLNAIRQAISKREQSIELDFQKVIDDKWWQKSVNNAAIILPSMLEVLAKGAKTGGYAAMGAMGTSAILGQLGPQALVPEEIITMPVAGATAFTAGMTVTGARTTQQIETGLAYWELHNLRDENGNRLDPTLVAGVSQSIGAINGALEAFGVGQLMKLIPGLRQIVMKQGKLVLQDMLRRGVFKQVALNYAKQYPKTIGIETGVEVAQEAVNTFSQELTKKLANELDDSEFDLKQTSEIINHLKDTFTTTASGMAIIAAPSPGINAIVDRRTEFQKKFPQASQVLPPDSVSDPGVQLANAYQEIKDIYLSKVDWRVFKNQAQNRQLYNKLRAITGRTKKVKRKDADKINSAIQLYIDSKRDPKKIQELVEEANKAIKEGRRASLTEEQLSTIEASQNLTPEQIKFADEIASVYEELGQLGLEEGIIRNIEDNYASRQWNLGSPDTREIYSTFFKGTRHAKQRVFNTIVEGWAAGMKLRVDGATQNLALYKDTIIKTLAQRKFFNALNDTQMSVKQPNGKRRRIKLLSQIKREGDAKVDLYEFKLYAPLDTEQPGIQIETDDGTILHETNVYAPKAIAKDLTALFGISKLKGIKGVDKLSKYNALLKSIVLSLSAFHACAFMRSYYLGAPINWMDPKSRNIFKAYRDGRNMMEDMDPIVQAAVEAGMTLELMQDWQTEYLRQSNIISVTLDKLKTTKVIKDKVVVLNNMWLGFLFSSFGSGLKVKSFQIEYNRLVQKHPNQDPKQIAKNVAELVNADFGGLHLKRLGRDPTLQHIFQMFALAPDWTESNLRTVTGLFRKAGNNPKAVRKIYQRFWGRIVTRGLVCTALANTVIALGFGKGEDRWESFEDAILDTQRSWRLMLKELGNGNIKRGYKRLTQGTDSATLVARNLFSVDVSPIYQYFGGEREKRKYFSIFGHFLDPIEFIQHPIQKLRHKGSIFLGASLELFTGEDWAGRRFTSLPELLEYGELTTYRSKYQDGVPLIDTWYVSYFLSQIIGHSPVGMQNLIASISGETDYFDDILKTFGLHISTRHD